MGWRERVCSFETHLCAIREQSERTQLGLQVTTLLARLGGEKQMPHLHQRSLPSIAQPWMSRWSSVVKDARRSPGKRLEVT